MYKTRGVVRILPQSVDNFDNYGPVQIVIVTMAEADVVVVVV